MSSSTAIFKLIARRLLERLSYTKITPKRIFCLGEPLSWIAAQLQQRYPAATVDAFSSHVKAVSKQPYDLVVANLYLPFVMQVAFLAQLRHCLNANGVVYLSAFGPDTFKQLHQFGLVEFTFADMHLLGDALVKQGFKEPVVDCEQLVIEYKNPAQVVTDIKTCALDQCLPGWDRLLAEAATAQLPSPYAVNFEIVYAHSWGVRPAHNEVHIAIDQIQRRR